MLKELVTDVGNLDTNVFKSHGRTTYTSFGWLREGEFTHCRFLLRGHQQVPGVSLAMQAFYQRVSSRFFISLVNSKQRLTMTGERPPMPPPNASDYPKYGLPWFDYYGEDLKVLEGSSTLGSLKGVAELNKQKCQTTFRGNYSINVQDEQIVKLNRKRSRVSEFNKTNQIR